MISTYQDTSALAHDEAVTVLVPGARRLGGVFVASGHRAARVEPAEPHWNNGSIGGSGNNKVGVAMLEVISSSNKAVVRCRARRGDRVVGTGEACSHQQWSCLGFRVYGLGLME